MEARVITEDIRDVESGEVYYALADKERGGRMVYDGMFPAIWRTRKAAATASNGNPNHAVVKCLKP